MSSSAVGISVILPVRNGAAHIEEQLQALSRQTYAGSWELVVADNASRDGTRALVEAWRDRIPNVVVVDAPRPGRAAACNEGARAARGAVFAFCDADDIVGHGWLAACVAATKDHDLVAGAIKHFAADGSAIPWKNEAVRRPTKTLYSVPFAMGANMAVSRTAFDAVGGFSEDLRISEDVDLSWRLHLAGYEIFFEPAAVVAKRARASLREEWRQAVQWGAADVELERRHGGTGLARPSFAGTARHVLGRAVREPRLAASLLRLRHRRFWVAAIGRRWGRLRAT